MKNILLNLFKLGKNYRGACTDCSSKSICWSSQAGIQTACISPNISSMLLPCFAWQIWRAACMFCHCIARPHLKQPSILLIHLYISNIY